MFKLSSWNLQSETVSHTVNPLVHKSLLASVHCKEPLVWSEVSAILSTLGTCLGSFWISCAFQCCGDPVALGLKVRTLQVLQQIIDGVEDRGGTCHILGSGVGSCALINTVTSVVQPRQSAGQAFP